MQAPTSADPHLTSEAKACRKGDGELVFSTCLSVPEMCGIGAGGCEAVDWCPSRKRRTGPEVKQRKGYRAAVRDSLRHPDSCHVCSRDATDTPPLRGRAVAAAAAGAADPSIARCRPVSRAACCAWPSAGGRSHDAAAAGLVLARGGPACPGCQYLLPRERACSLATRAPNIFRSSAALTRGGCPGGFGA